MKGVSQVGCFEEASRRASGTVAPGRRRMEQGWQPGNSPGELLRFQRSRPPQGGVVRTHVACQRSAAERQRPPPRSRVGREVRVASVSKGGGSRPQLATWCPWPNSNSRGFPKPMDRSNSVRRVVAGRSPVPAMVWRRSGGEKTISFPT